MIEQSLTIKLLLSSLSGGVLVVFGVEPVFILVLVGLSALDLLTGIIKAKINKKPIHSTPLFNGALKKVLPLLAIMAISGGVVALEAAYGLMLNFINMALVMWFIGVEVKSNLENIQESGVLIPSEISKRIDKAFNTNFSK